MSRVTLFAVLLLPLFDLCFALRPINTIAKLVVFVGTCLEDLMRCGIVHMDFDEDQARMFVGHARLQMGQRVGLVIWPYS